MWLNQSIAGADMINSKRVVGVRVDDRQWNIFFSHRIEANGRWVFQYFLFIDALKQNIGDAIAMAYMLGVLGDLDPK